MKRLRNILLSVVLMLTGLAFAGASAGAASSLPCDIYGSAGTPCVGAHSTVRALYAAYNGPLYQVRRADGATTDIGLLSPGGIANGAAQDSFCANTSCIISEIYDQSPRHNDLTIEGAGGAGAADVGAPADALPISIGGHTAYGVEITSGMGYRDNSTSGVAVNGQPEGMYMVASATHVNGGCCFDYGNAETNNQDTGDGHMDAVYLGLRCEFGNCNGSGPWVAADLENGLFQSNTGSNAGDPGPGATPYVTAMLSNNGQDHFTLKRGDAQNGDLTTTYSGSEPTVRNTYSPLHQEGAIVLGTGGDNSNADVGSFFEGVMTAGVPTDAADSAVQSSIVSAGYGGSNGVAGGALTPGSSISLRATTACCTTRYLRHSAGDAITSVITADSSALDKNDATWIVRRGLANNSCLSFESKNYPGEYLRHANYQLHRQPDDGSALLANDATFCPAGGNSGSYTSFQSDNYPGYYIRHYDSTVYIAHNGGSNPWDTTTSWADDTTWEVAQPWA
ncbi:alpha-L-arabinofuranosidase B [Amycolatopsis saalfeldensis]|uniref:Alpha-L-arabinofuranosidase B (ABFB) domain-containing protein n=1 Tax=Amycolatopsis saalfeldensis TaxID=394193 RepID=A0A1H8VX17_9PSEU|nr:alpha-L-arabinofuranosidase B [Amycolatopsis saalfeldensis]SEP19885.1 Alpha-L-arabinofuranosidase B (ABFB) domain-containing protein [Amycolatopsis saalfeldensis]